MVLTTPKGMSVETRMTDTEAVACLRELADNGHKFAGDLIFKLNKYGSFTTSQLAWVHKLANEHRFGKPTLPKVDLNLSPIVALFDGVAGTLKAPKIVFDFEDHPVTLYVAGQRSKYVGCVYVTDGVKGGKWFGRIHRDGRFEASQHCHETIIGFLKLFAADPAKLAADYGKSQGRCCFCRRTLTDERSLAVGYGPDCSSRYHLPWGEK